MGELSQPITLSEANHTSSTQMYHGTPPVEMFRCRDKWGVRTYVAGDGLLVGELDIFIELGAHLVDVLLA